MSYGKLLERGFISIASAISKGKEYIEVRLRKAEAIYKNKPSTRFHLKVALLLTYFGTIYANLYNAWCKNQMSPCLS